MKRVQQDTNFLELAGGLGRGSSYVGGVVRNGIICRIRVSHQLSVWACSKKKEEQNQWNNETRRQFVCSNELLAMQPCIIIKGLRDDRHRMKVRSNPQEINLSGIFFFNSGSLIKWESSTGRQYSDCLQISLEDETIYIHMWV